MSKTIQVWKIPLLVSDDIVGAYAQCLSPDERSRAARFRFEKDRRRFIVTRGTLRYLLAQKLDQQPSAISFCYGEYGKPSIAREQVPLNLVQAKNQATTAQSASGHCDFHFNVSHSGELALCALGYQRRVGIDIEKIKDIQRLDSMTERCLVETEQADVSKASDPLRAFLRRWTCKEAYLKAIGVGLIQSMTTVEVQFNPPRFEQVPQGCTTDWNLSLIDVPEGYVSALAIEGKAAVEILRWQHRLPGP